MNIHHLWEQYEPREWHESRSHMAPQQRPMKIKPWIVFGRSSTSFVLFTSWEFVVCFVCPTASEGADNLCFFVCFQELLLHQQFNMLFVSGNFLKIKSFVLNVAFLSSSLCDTSDLSREPLLGGPDSHMPTALKNKDTKVCDACFLLDVSWMWCKLLCDSCNKQSQVQKKDCVCFRANHS